MKHKQNIQLNDPKRANGTIIESQATPKQPTGMFNRRDALQKACGYAAFTATSMLAVLMPRKAVASSGYSTPAEAPTGNKSPGTRPANPYDQ